ncbi:MAG: histidine triad nucleotide-binding protein [Acidimicrobiales bacterium]
MQECLFCQIVQRKLPAEIVLENDQVVAFKDIAPVAPLHVLVVPRTHVKDAATLGPHNAQDLTAMFLAAREVAAGEGLATDERGYRLVLNVGRDSANSVPHLHLHVIGGRQMTWPPG